VSFTPETLLRQWQTLRMIPRHPRKVTATLLRESLNQDGFTVGKRTVERDLQSLAMIQGFGDAVEVVKPLHLRKQIAESVHRLSERYGK
jgi:predicted DNA-binding transcriptional regulator YafY